MNTLFYNMLETASAYHNAEMGGQRWTDDLQKVYDNINGVAGQIFYMKENQ